MPKDDIQQIALLSDATYALSIPNRATSNLENDLKVVIRHQIQKIYRPDMVFTAPIKLSIDIKQIAKEKGVYWKTLERHLDDTIEALKQIPLNETVRYIDENGDIKSDTLYILDKISKNETQKTIDVHVGLSYAEYMAKRMLKNPELQTDPHFFLSGSSQYLLPFTQWLTGRIFIAREKEPEKYPYEIYVTLDEIMQSVPTSANYVPTDYRIKVLDKVIKEINTNDYSQLIILNPSPKEYVKKNGRSISGFFFRVALRERTALNKLPLFYSNGEALPLDDNVPPWNYIKVKLRQLGYGGKNDEAAYKRIDKLHSPLRVWKALLCTWVGLQKKYETEGRESVNGGGYFQTIYSKGELSQSAKELAYEVCRKAPYYADDTVRAVAGITSNKLGFNESGQPIAKQTIENNEFLKNFNDKHGHLPGAMQS